MTSLKGFFTTKRIIAISVSFGLVGLVIWMLLLRPKQTLVALVPEHACWYLEVDRPLEILKSVQKGVRLYTDPGLTFFAEWQEELGYVQNLLQKETTISQYLQKATIGISAHVLTGKEAGYVFYMPLNGAEQDRLFGLLKNFYGRIPEYKYSERQYMNSRIAEITFKKEGTNFSIASVDGTLFGSFSGFLVEEVVRRSGLIFKPNFAEKLKRDHRYTGISAKPVRLFLNLQKVSEFFYQYVSSTMQGLRLASSLGEGIALGFGQPTGMDWVLEGYLINEQPKEKGHHKQLLNKEFRKYLSGSDAICFQFSLAEVWSVFPDKVPVVEDGNMGLSQAMEPEILLAWLEGEGLKKYDKLLISKVKNQEKMKDWLNSNQVAGSPKDLYREQIGNSEIIQHSNSHLGSLLGGSLMADWMPMFYAFDNSYLLVSDDIETLRRSIRQKDSKKQTDPLASESSYFSWTANSSRCLPLLMENGAGYFKKNFDEWIPLIRGVSNITLSDNGEEENPSVTMKISLKVPTSIGRSWEERERNFFDTTLITPPYRMEWKGQNQNFWAIQDQNLKMHVLGTNLKPIFNFQLFSPIPETPQLMESPDRKSVSFLFHTTKSLRIINFSGKEIVPSPLLLPDSTVTIEHAAAIDYDQSFHYRLMASGRYGEVYMSDMQGKYLDGWNPYRNENALSIAPQHLRIAQKDLIILLDRKGKLKILNRKAEMMSGFPVQLSGRTDQPIFIERGLNLKTSYIYTLSEFGQVEKINFEGKSESKIQLFRPGKDTRFQFCIDQRKKTFSVARITDKQVTVFDQSYRPIFDFQTATPQMVVQHFNFGASNKIYAIVDKGVSECHLFTETGHKINPERIETDQMIDIVQKEGTSDEFEIIKAFKNKLSLVSFLKD